MAEALQAFIDKSRLKNGLMSVQLEEMWADMMGKTISKYTEKVQLINNTLFIKTNVAALKNELQYQKDTIKTELNRRLGKVIVKTVIIN